MAVVSKTYDETQICQGSEVGLVGETSVVNDRYTSLLTDALSWRVWSYDFNKVLGGATMSEPLVRSWY